MARTNIEIALQIYELSFQVVLAAVDHIAAEPFTWKPASESRSISEICRHLIRVENWFLTRLGVDPLSKDPGKCVLPDVQAALESSHSQIAELVQALEDDAALRQKVESGDAARQYSPDYVIKHASQHNLYHVAQIIYLRRSQDRDWQAPLKQWETAVDAISEHTWKD